MELKISGLSKIFTAVTGETIFHLELPEMKFQYGSVNYILGHNGSGKSVFLKLISGELLPTDSIINIVHQNKSYTTNQMNVAIVRQNAEDNICLDLSVEENLIIRLSINTIKKSFFPKNMLKQQIIDALDGHNELLMKTKQVCSELSGGQSQVLAFLSATSQKSVILCLDEFLSSTDHNTSILLRQKAKDYAKQFNACVLIVSHDFDVALEDADEIFIFNNGRLASQIQRNSSLWNKTDLVRLVHFS